VQDGKNLEEYQTFGRKIFCKTQARRIFKSTSEKILTQKEVVAKPPASPLMQSTGDKCINSDALMADIMWTLFSVFKVVSDISAKDRNAIFCKMFSDSVVVSQFQLGFDKLKYLANWEIVPHI